MYVWYVQTTTHRPFRKFPLCFLALSFPFSFTINNLTVCSCLTAPVLYTQITVTSIGYQRLAHPYLHFYDNPSTLCVSPLVFGFIDALYSQSLPHTESHHSPLWLLSDSPTNLRVLFPTDAQYLLVVRVRDVFFLHGICEKVTRWVGNSSDRLCNTSNFFMFTYVYYEIPCYWETI